MKRLPLPAERPLVRHRSSPSLPPCGPLSPFLPGPSHACFLVPDPPVRGCADPQTTEHPLATTDGRAPGKVGGAKGGGAGRRRLLGGPSTHTCHLRSSLKSLVLTAFQRETE